MSAPPTVKTNKFQLERNLRIEVDDISHLRELVDNRKERFADDLSISPVVIKTQRLLDTIPGTGSVLTKSIDKMTTLPPLNATIIDWDSFNYSLGQGYFG
jgi:hypothetical protein